mmetsp:Transcript_2952/g.4690  ORF Transcript_2952/g.4690 Transcript_2952/m.4690 type:complete len:204 (-) Transcript_2952:117-728(-)
MRLLCQVVIALACKHCVWAKLDGSAPLDEPSSALASFLLAAPPQAIARPSGSRLSTVRSQSYDDGFGYDELEVSDFEIGMVVDAVITKILPFGAFLQVEGSVPGLLHKSEITGKDIDSVEKIFPVGSSIKAMIISIRKNEGRLGLSTKAFEKYPGEMLTKKKEIFALATNKAYELNVKVQQEKNAKEAAVRSFFQYFDKVFAE